MIEISARIVRTAGLIVGLGLAVANSGCMASNEASSSALKKTDKDRPSEREMSAGSPNGKKNRGLGLAGMMTAKADTSCLPSVVKSALSKVSDRYGPVVVSSTGRSVKSNLRAGGRDKSMHLACRAADFRVRGRNGGVMSYLKTIEGLGGVKMYANGIIHIDNGPKRSW